MKCRICGDANKKRKQAGRVLNKSQSTEQQAQTLVKGTAYALQESRKNSIH